MTAYTSETINGETQVFVIIGDPVGQVQAPQLMNAIFRDSGSNSVMVPMQVSSEDAPMLIEALKATGNVGGFLATIPHKFELLHHADHVGTIAQAAGCANALRRNLDGTWSTENFDGVGFVVGMGEAGHDLTDKSVAIYGAGGAGSSIAAASLNAGAAKVHIFDLLQSRCEQLCQRLDERWAGRSSILNGRNHGEFDVVVNATPIGLAQEDGLPFSFEGLRSDAIVAEIIMKPKETRLLREAAALGFKTQPGFAMLEPQIELYRDFFRIPVRECAGASGPLLYPTERMS